MPVQQSTACTLLPGQPMSNHSLYKFMTTACTGELSVSLVFLFDGIRPPATASTGWYVERVSLCVVALVLEQWFGKGSKLRAWFVKTSLYCAFSWTYSCLPVVVCSCCRAIRLLQHRGCRLFSCMFSCTFSFFASSVFVQFASVCRRVAEIAVSKHVE